MAETVREVMARKLKELREAANLTPQEVADRVGKSAKTIYAWESERGQPDADMLIRLCRLYGADITEFYDFAKSSREDTPSWVEVPFFGSIAAGEPIEMIDRGDTYLIPQSIASEHPNSGVFQAAGNSWNKGGIFDGFYIVVDFDIVEPANEHEPFAVSINDTCTVKSIQRLENGVRLLPNSYDETIKPIVLDYDDNDGTMAKTLGKVVWTFAPFNYGF